jgi:hypothetical protein
MRFSILWVTLICWGGIACSSSKKTAHTASKTTPKKIVCGAEKTGSPKVLWTLVDNPTADLVKDFKLPTTFTTYSLDANQLSTFFAAANADGASSILSIPLPAEIGCQEFVLKSSGTMASGLQKNFPQIVSLKGGAFSPTGIDARIDYDGTRMRGQITWELKVYYVTPITVNDNTLYIVYAATDATVPRRPFERSARDLRTPQRIETSDR